MATFEGASGVRFDWAVETGRVYQALGSEDLQTWSPLGDPFLPAATHPFVFPEGSHGFVQLLPEYHIDETDLRIVIIGDSTVADLSPLSRQLHGWGQVMADFFQPTAAIVNQAGPGIGTVRFLEEGSISRVRLVKPQVVLMQFGHIDDDESLPEADFEANLRLIVNEVRDIDAIPVFVAPVARRIYDAQGNLINLLEARRQSMLELSREMQIQLIDLNGRSAELYRRYGEEATTFVTVCGDQCDDRSHFSRTGSYVMAALAADEFPALLQAYRVPLESLVGNVVAAFENDRKFESLSTPFVDLTGFEDEEIWSWVFPE